MGKSKTMKILISAYSCEPARGSERGVGWNVVREVARYHEVWVLTRPDESREAIEKELSVNPIPTLHFVYFTLPFWQDSLSLGQSGAMQLHYYLWQIQAYFVGRNLHQKMNFDAIHHVTFVRYSCPSFLSLLPIPFVWGPVGGGESAPLPFWTDFTWKNKLYEVARLAWRSLGEIDFFTHLTSRRSKIAYAATEETAQRLSILGASQVEICSAIGLSTNEIDRLAQSISIEDDPIRFISIGRLLHWKGFHLGLRAFAKAKLTEAEYWIIGNGPELKRLQILATDLGIIEQVRFWGELGRNEVLHKIGQCSVLVHPSLHDSGAGVCLEAMATAKPIICLDLGGPAAQVSADNGCKVPAENPEQAVCALSAAMIKLAGDRTLCIQMGKAGQQKVRDSYSWEAKAKRFADIYKALAAEHTIN
jgi:glycosyltransferase involved in cell wall biosynthesis